MSNQKFCKSMIIVLSLLMSTQSYSQTGERPDTSVNENADDFDAFEADETPTDFQTEPSSVTGTPSGGQVQSGNRNQIPPAAGQDGNQVPSANVHNNQSGNSGHNQGTAQGMGSTPGNSGAMNNGSQSSANQQPSQQIPSNFQNRSQVDARSLDRNKRSMEKTQPRNQAMRNTEGTTTVKKVQKQTKTQTRLRPPSSRTGSATGSAGASVKAIIMKDVESLLDSKMAYEGKRVAVTGEIKKKIDTRSLVLEGGGVLNDEIVVLTSPRIQVMTTSFEENEDVTVTGVVRLVTISELRKQYGWDVDSQLEADLQHARAFLIADNIIARR